MVSLLFKLSNLNSENKKTIIAGIIIAVKWPTVIVNAERCWRYFFIILTFNAYRNEHRITNPA